MKILCQKFQLQQQEVRQSQSAGFRLPPKYFNNLESLSLKFSELECYMCQQNEGIEVSTV